MIAVIYDQCVQALFIKRTGAGTGAEARRMRIIAGHSDECGLLVFLQPIGIFVFRRIEIAFDQNEGIGVARADADNRFGVFSFTSSFNMPYSSLSLSREYLNRISDCG